VHIVTIGTVGQRFFLLINKKA